MDNEKSYESIERVELPEMVPEYDDDVIICRCEEITKGEIREAVHLGLWTVNEVKRFLRPGMGLCQGRSCGPTVKRIIAKERGISPAMLEDATPRTPVRAIEIGILGNEVTANE